jgi:hypothetical protein
MIGDPVTEEFSRRDAEPVNLYAAAHTTRRQTRPLLPKSGRSVHRYLCVGWYVTDGRIGRRQAVLVNK